MTQIHILEARSITDDQYRDAAMAKRPLFSPDDETPVERHPHHPHHAQVSGWDWGHNCPEIVLVHDFEVPR